jgi:RHS repeat-associated protein
MKSGRGRFWKVFGPDLNGRFGGLQGTGGLEAVILDADGTTTGVINDQFGNGVATVSGTGSGASVTWNTTRVGAYGPLPGVQAQTLTDVSQVAAATAWRSRRIDPTGFYWLGARYYEPTSGRFLSADPMGQAASPSLYDFCNGDPVNNVDPLGLEPGHPYPTPDVAAWHAANESNPQSIKQNTEFACVVYRNPDGTYSYTAPRPATPDESRGLSPGEHLEDGQILVGDLHTHANYSKKDGTVTDKAGDETNSDAFSDTDKAGYDGIYRDNLEHNNPDPYYGYLATPSGSFQRYAPNGDPLRGDIKSFPVDTSKPPQTKKPSCS